jgi:hypothetical protein
MRRVLSVIALLSVGLAGARGKAQDSTSARVLQPAAPASSAALPDAPDVVRPNGNVEPQQTKRILGVIPNFRAVSTTEHLPPQSVKDKFVMATQDSFDYTSVVIPASLAGIGLMRNSSPEFGSGTAGYGNYLWHNALDQTIENYMVEFVVPAIAHEDTRYYTLGTGGFMKRTEYALSRAVITRSDSGTEVINLGEIVGAGAGAGLSNAYYPASDRTVGHLTQQWSVNIGIDAAAFVAKEFWPDIHHRFFHDK